ncbi:PQQ-like beta-propeller repeat protein [Mariniblastus sp.]|nr:PQQ-like beta-propeller repeat protein [Mariniblastus sp.]
MSNTARSIAIYAFATLLFCNPGSADDWPRFRGLQGAGVGQNSDALPNVWSPSENIAWKVRLPGPGASSPIVVNGKVLVTCYSGYGVTKDKQSDIKDLMRNLICIDLASGKILWQNNIEASLPEDPYYKSGVSSHGYASHTPVSDGTNVYTFFGKGGVFAFDLDGNELWRADAGKESDPPTWGSSSSPILYRDTLIVTASAESQSIIGFDTLTGQEKWRQSATGLDGMWGTPILAPVNKARTDLVMLVPGEIWGLDPATGKLRWHATAAKSQQAYTSVIADGQRVYAFSGQGGGSIAIDAGGMGNVSDTRVIWKGPVNAIYGSPVRYESDLYIIARGILSAVDTMTGKRELQMRLKGERKTGNSRFGSLDYASPIVVGDRLFYLNASGQVYVFQLGKNVELLAVNEVTSEKEVFWGSPALSNGRLLLRGSKFLYCITDGHGDLTDPPLAIAPKIRTVRTVRTNEDTDSDLGISKLSTKPERPQRPETAEDND